MAVRTSTDEALTQKPRDGVRPVDTVETRTDSWSARVIIAAAALALLVAVGAVGEPLASIDCDGEGTPAFAVIEIEFAANAEDAVDILEETCGSSVSAMNDALLGDLLYIALYGLAFWLAVTHLSDRGYRMEGMRQLRSMVAKLVFAAMAFDLIENGFLALGFNLEAQPDWAFRFAATAAWGKFICLAAVLAYVLGALAGFVSNPFWLQKAMTGESFAERSERHDTPLPKGGSQLAVSGGGVRSASFALGGLQAADDSPFHFEKNTRATAVSGGAYMVGAWTIGRLGPAAEPTAWRHTDGAGRNDETVSPEEAHLRDNLNYLLKADPDNRPDAIPTILLGVAVNTVILASLLVLVSLPVGWFMRWLDPSLTQPFGEDRDWSMPARASVVGVWALIALAITVVWVLSARLMRGRKLLGVLPFHRFHTSFRPAAYGAMAVTGVTALLLIALPFAMVEFPARILTPGSTDSANPGLLAAVLAVASGLGITNAVRKVLKDELSARMINLGGYLLLAFGLVVGGWIATEAAINGPVDRTVTAWAIGAGVFALVYWGANPDWWSFAPFYRGRLRTAYALRRRPWATSTPADPPVPRPEVGREAKPQHDVEALSSRHEPLLADPCFRTRDLKPEIYGAVQVRDSRVATHAGIPALSLTMGTERLRLHLPRLAGGDGAEFSCTPEQMQAAFRMSENPPMTTMWAVGISGAAVNPSMGRLSKGSTRALLAFANVRLGVWIPNPRWARMIDVPSQPTPEEPCARPDDIAWTPTELPNVAYPRVRLTYLFKEMFGLHDLKDAYVHAADGGHWENTAISQLLRVGPDRGEPLQEVLALDSSGGNPASANGLAEAISLVALEHDRHIDIDIEPTRATADETRGGGVAQECFSVGLIRQHDHVNGVLWYTRPVLTEHQSAQLLAFAERDDDFPGDSTANQLFEIERFESYRRLGNENVRHLLAEREVLVGAIRAAATLSDFQAAGRAKNAPYVVASVVEATRCRCDFKALKLHFTGEVVDDPSMCLRHRE